MEDDAAEPGSGGVEPTSEPIEPPTQAQIDKAESLIRQAAVARRRNEFGLARKLTEEAEQTAPGSVVVLEALGDLLMEQRKWTQAKELYQRALKIEPENAGIERKFGECVLNLYTASGMFAPTDDTLVGGKAAVWLSLIVPGLGQLASERYSKGSMMLGGWALGWTIAWLIPDGMRGLFNAIGISGRGGGAPFNPVVMLPVGFAVIFHLWSIFDAASKAGPSRPTRIERPVPPVDKDFEL